MRLAVRRLRVPKERKVFKMRTDEISVEAKKSKSVRMENDGIGGLVIYES